MITVRNLCKWYGDHCALQGASLNVAEGDCVVLCGPSGSGKSTLLRCLNGLEEWSEGKIEIDGSPIRHTAKDLRKLRREMGMVFQNFNLFPHLTALGNVSIGPRVILRQKRAEAEDSAISLLEQVGIGQFADRYPDELSGGQQQRVAIARALAMKPRALLFDEPTSALDPESVKDVLDVMIALVRDGVTIIVVTHEMGFARKVADKIVLLDRGLVVEVADPDEFFQNPKSQRAKEFVAQAGIEN